MKTAHAGMGIASADFDALVQDLVASQSLLGVLGPMKKDVAEK
jgi:hypothetical protein